jgi:hypothetical protein
MNSDWELVYHDRVVEMLAIAKGHQKAALARAFTALRQDPYRVPDYSERDATGRTLSVMTCGEWAVSYWLDHFVREIRVVSLEDVGS